MLNKAELEKSLKADKSQFEPYGDEHVMCYSYIVRVNKQGDVSEIRFSSADNTWIIDEIEKSLKQIKYEVAIKDNMPTDCIYFVQHKFYLTE